MGDVDADGDLDLAVGNDGQPNRVYVNVAGSLETSARWSSDESDDTYCVAWGDIDGDLDPTFGNEDQPNRSYANSLFRGVMLTESPVKPRLNRPGLTPDAAGYSSAEWLTWPTVTVEFELREDEDDTAPLVGLLCSTGGGGLWLPATVTGGTTGLEASGSGTAHSLAWDVAADGVTGDNVVLRLTVEYQAPRRSGGPLVRPRVSFTSPSFSVRPCDPSVDECCTPQGTFEADGASCDDGVFCNGQDTCQGHVCTSPGVDPCAAGNGQFCDGVEVCNEGTDSCDSPGDPCAAGNGQFCDGAEVCNETTDACDSAGDPCPGPEGDGDCVESCDEDVDACTANDPNGAPCDVGTCQAGICDDGSGGAGGAGTGGSGTGGTGTGGSGTGGSGTGGSGTSTGAGTGGSGTGGSGTSTGAGTGTGSGPDIPPASTSGDEGGCGCQTAGAPKRSTLRDLLLALLGVAALGRRRRRSR